MSSFRYVSPQTLDEAVAVLASHSQALPLAGGYTVLLPANRGHIAGALLVDLHKIQALAGVERLAGGALKIGAMTTIGALAVDKLLLEHLPALADSALLVGDAQVQNRATIAGNIAAGETGADLPALLLALDARIQVAGQRGSREISAGEFLAEPSAALARDELIVSIVIPVLTQRSGLAYEKIKHPATLFALCGVAAAVQLTSDGAVGDVRVAVTGASARVERLPGVEQALKKRAANDASIASAARANGNKPAFLNDLFASAEYRGHLTHVLTERALKRAIATAAA